MPIYPPRPRRLDLEISMCIMELPHRVMFVALLQICTVSSSKAHDGPDGDSAVGRGGIGRGGRLFLELRPRSQRALPRAPGARSAYRPRTTLQPRISDPGSPSSDDPGAAQARGRAR